MPQISLNLGVLPGCYVLIGSLSFVLVGYDMPGDQKMHCTMLLHAGHSRALTFFALVFKMMARVFVLILALFVLFGDASSTANPSPSACHCRPVINVAVDGNGQCDLCATNKQLLQEVDARGGRGGLLRSNRIMGMCRWIGSPFQEWIDYNGVAFSIELLEWGRKFSGFGG